MAHHGIILSPTVEVLLRARNLEWMFFLVMPVPRFPRQLYKQKFEVNKVAVEDNIAVSDILNFARRQGKVFILVFAIVFAVGVFYALKKPALYRGAVSLNVGEIQYFTPVPKPVEAPEELAYRYMGRAAVTPVRNTRIVEVSVVSVSPDLSVDQLKEVSKEITEWHAKIFQKKKDNFSEYLGAINMSESNKIEILRLLDNASSASETRVLGGIQVQELRYGGMLFRLLAGFTFLALIVALASAFLKDFFERRK